MQTVEMDDPPLSPPVVSGTLIDSLRRRLRADTGQAVSLVETHISWILLAEHVAYKVKKPVRLAFVDFSTLALRRHFCDEELRLNRRFAPSLYLGVVPVCGTAQSPHIGGSGEPIDYAVCMRRFPPGALLSEQLAAGSLRPEQLEALARRVAAFQQQASIASPAPADETVQRVNAPVLAVLQQLRRHGDSARIDTLAAWFTGQGEVLRDEWCARRRDGRVREGHGDLHLANVVLIDDEAMPFDCIEFDPALRCIDVLSDVAFLTMDLKAAGRADLTFCFLDAYLQCSGDYAGLRVLRFYEVYRALVRALVARLRSNVVAPSGPDYLACAERILQGCAAPRLLITSGLSGSGKSTLARLLLASAGAIRLRSDVERKRLFGLAALERSADRERVYGPDATRQTFERLAQCARAALEAGYPVIVDAAFLRRTEREAFRALATELRLPFTILLCTADEASLRERVAARGASGTDASEADLDVLERQRRHTEPLSDEEHAFAIEVATDKPLDLANLSRHWLAQRYQPEEDPPMQLPPSP